MKRSMRRGVIQWVGAMLTLWPALALAAGIQSHELSSAGGAPAPTATGDDRVVIGVLLPLSGPEAAVGKIMLDSATLALYDMQRSKPLLRRVTEIRLLPKDTGGTPEGAQKGMRELVRAHAVGVIGPLFSNEFESVIPLAMDANIPLVSFTNNPVLAGRGAYQLGFFAAEQASRLAEYAARQRVVRVSGVATADGYGRQVLDQLAHALKGYNIPFGPSVFLTPDSQVGDLALAPLIKTVKEQGSKRQIVFLAEQSPQLEMVVAGLAKARVLRPNLVLAGTGAWDDPVQLQSPALRGAIFVSTPQEGYAQFARKYQMTYQSWPPRIASVAYDAVALMAGLAFDGGAGAITAESLERKDGFATPANGLLRFGPDGMAQRRLAVYQATGNGSAVLLDEAPKDFTSRAQ